MRAFFSQPLVARLLVLAGLLLLLMVPLSMIDGLVGERGRLQAQAGAELAQAHAGEQTLVGPLLVLPYVEHWSEVERDERGQVRAEVPRSRSGVQLVFPQQLDLRGTLAPQERYRGIFAVPFYQLQARLAGRFAPFDPATLPRREKDSRIEPLAPFFVLVPSDVRGIQGMPALVVGEAAARFQPGVPALGEGAWLARGVHAPLPPEALAAWREQRPLPFDLQLTLVGQQHLAIAPVADETLARLASPWPHPGFAGQFLPVERSVGAQGFEARWAVASLVSPARAQVVAALGSDKPPPQLHAFSVSLMQPVSVYSLTDRAIKYALLFVVLVLGATVLFELLRGPRLHPVQYALVGTSIALFFLLLLALSEKLDFAVAYAAAAGASVLLLTTYFSAVLGGWRAGCALGGYTGVLYAVLFFLLRSEDNALLLGALLMFGLLSLLMLGTRRVDWYSFGAR